MIRIGLIDGSLPAHWPGLAACKRFCKPDGTTSAGRHAVAMAETIRFLARADLQFINAVVFPGRLVTSQQTVCDAVNWLAEHTPDIVLCSFGMAQSSVDLRVGISRLRNTGSLVVASAPARGDPVYPAAIEGVISVQGDARCDPEELSRLDLPQATFGACPVSASDPDIRGASPAAAHMAGLLARHWKGENSLRALTPAIRYRGRERRGATETPKAIGAG